MNEPLPEVVVAASRLRAAIEETATALAGADLERLLACDALLQKALTYIPRPASLPASVRLLLRQELEAAHSAMRRCRRLGTSLNDFARFSLDAQGQGVGYNPSGAATPLVTGRSFNQKA